MVNSSFKIRNVGKFDFLDQLEGNLYYEIRYMNKERFHKTETTFTPRDDYLKLPEGYEKEDAYPWRFNRKYSFNRRPVLQRGETLIWGNRNLYHMAEYLTDLIYSGKFNSNSKEVKAFCGKISNQRGEAFNQLIFQMILDMKVFTAFPKVRKINGKRIAENGLDLGDIDILIIDSELRKIVVAEVKNLRFSRNPYEIQQEYKKMFVDGDKPCFATKHNKRKKWMYDHLDDVKHYYQLDGNSWTVTSLFIVNQSLISQYIYKQNIKCISKAELSVETIRET